MVKRRSLVVARLAESLRLSGGWGLSAARSALVTSTVTEILYEKFWSSGATKKTNRTEQRRKPTTRSNVENKPQRKRNSLKSTEKAMNTRFIVAVAAIFVSGFVSGLMIGMIL